MTPDPSNLKFQMAADYVNLTNRHVFLTGRAGTGKTTFLKYIKENTHKQTAVVAPTGVAAINAGGVTMHSFFQLPFSPFIPATKRGFTSGGELSTDKHALLAKLRFNKEKLELMRSLELLIIDEISMVRADTLDAIDTIMRFVRRNTMEAFGGVQVLFIGDMYQLPPVVPNHEWQILSEYYNSPFFFDSQVVLEEPPLYIELDKIYRQNEQDFIDVLNKVRNNRLDDEGVEMLESRYLPMFQPRMDEKYIRLATHNKMADETNINELSKLMGSLQKFKADVTGEFGEKSYPAEENLHLKEGAQVMFIKNDVEKVRRYFNGKIGVVTKFEKDQIIVQCDDQEIKVKKEKWQNLQYTVNKEKQEVEEKEVGSFTQYPLRLAWAITIHKSQGLTFEKAIIDAGAAFAPGQVYVALSRCTSLEGMILHSKINPASVFTDPRIVEFARKKANDTSLQSQLDGSKKAYQCDLLQSLFHFAPLEIAARKLEQAILQHSSSFVEETLPWASQMLGHILSLKAMADKFKPILLGYLQQDFLPADNEALNKRLKGASVHFNERLQPYVVENIVHHPASTDSTVNAAAFDGALFELYALAKELVGLMDSCKDGFEIEKFTHIKGQLQIGKLSWRIRSSYAGSTAGSAVKNNSTHPDLYRQLKQFRDTLAQERNAPIYMVANSATLEEMSNYLPHDLNELGMISGFGPARLKQYGQAFVDIIVDYAQANNFTSLISQKGTKTVKKEKIGALKADTKQESLRLFKEGKTIVEIATERTFTTGTIEGHLAHFIPTGEVVIFDLMPVEKVDLLIKTMADNPNASTSEIKEMLPPDIGFNHIRMVQTYRVMNG